MQPELDCRKGERNPRSVPRSGAYAAAGRSHRDEYGRIAALGELNCVGLGHADRASRTIDRDNPDPSLLQPPLKFPSRGNRPLARLSHDVFNSKVPQRSTQQLSVETGSYQRNQRSAGWSGKMRVSQQMQEHPVIGGKD